MILVDSNVWIDYFNGTENAGTDQLDVLLGVEPLAVGDYIVLEVLQGFRSDDQFHQAKELLDSLTTFQLLDEELALAAAQNYRMLRKKGITVRKSIDTVIATFCIERNHQLLFADRDFMPFVDHLGLEPATR